jgi:SEC-C motif-containing protein
MKSRYTAYATGNADYIVKTTHPDSPHFEKDVNEWKRSVKEFGRSEFKKLEIIEFIDGEKEAFVEFKAYIDDYVMTEKSRFLKEDKWYYFDGTEK